MKDFIKIGFTEFKNPYKKDSLRRLQWTFFREVGQIISVVIVYANDNWQVEYVSREGDKIIEAINDFDKDSSIEELLVLVEHLEETYKIS